jgi:hypothetical protein
MCLPPAFTLVCHLVYSCTLKMETICSSETSVDSQRSTWCSIAEDSTFYNDLCENLKSYRIEIVPSISSSKHRNDTLKGPLYDSI